MIVVLGLYRGGSSCVAGVLHWLGVCMGHEIKRHNEYVCWEDWPMRRACLQCYTEPGMDELAGFDRRVDHLRRYMLNRHTEKATQPQHENGLGTLAIPYKRCACEPMGVKFPMLCAMGPEMVEAWGDKNLRFVSVERDPATCAAGSVKWFGDRAAPLAERMYDDRAAFLYGRDHITVNYEDLCEDPEHHVTRLSERLLLNPSPGRLQCAIESVCRKVVVA